MGLLGLRWGGVGYAGMKNRGAWQQHLIPRPPLLSRLTNCLKCQWQEERGEGEGRGKLEREAARGSEKLSEKKRCLAFLHVSPVQSLLFPLLLREGQAASKYLSQIQASAPPPCPVEYAFPCDIFSFLQTNISLDVQKRRKHW